MVFVFLDKAHYTHTLVSFFLSLLQSLCNHRRSWIVSIKNYYRRQVPVDLTCCAHATAKQMLQMAPPAAR